MRVATSSSTRRLGSAAAWPVAVQAQQGDRVRRIGVLMPFGETDPEAKAWLSGFTAARIDVRQTVATLQFEHAKHEFGNQLLEAAPPSSPSDAENAPAPLSHALPTIELLPRATWTVARRDQHGGNQTAR
jgi:hypothetical protein